MKIILAAIFIFWSNIFLFAQDSKSLLNKPAPALSFEKIINYEKPRVQSSDFKSKILIIGRRGALRAEKATKNSLRFTENINRADLKSSVFRLMPIRRTGKTLPQTTTFFGQTLRTLKVFTAGRSPLTKSAPSREHF